MSNHSGIFSKEIAIGGNNHSSLRANRRTLSSSLPDGNDALVAKFEVEAFSLVVCYSFDYCLFPVFALWSRLLPIASLLDA